MKTVKLEVPASWLVLLCELEAAGFKACIAGGALRDLYHGRKIKDVDVFVFGEHGRSEALAQWAAAYGWDETIGGTTDYDGLPATDGEQVMGALGRIWTFCGMDGYEYNVIQMLSSAVSSVEDCAERCDFGICQIAVTSEGHVQVTDAFIADAANRRFTLVHAHSPARSATRWQRLREKYPEYMLVGIGEEFA